MRRTMKPSFVTWCRQCGTKIVGVDVWSYLEQLKYKVDTIVGLDTHVQQGSLTAVVDFYVSHIVRNSKDTNTDQMDRPAKYKSIDSIIPVS